MAEPTSWESIALDIIRPPQPKISASEWLVRSAARAREEAAQQLAEKAARKRKRRGSKRIATPTPGEHQAQTDGRAKLTQDDVRAIRRRHAAGENRNDLAQEFGVSSRSINLIASRRRWAHVPD